MIRILASQRVYQPTIQNAIQYCFIRRKQPLKPKNKGPFKANIYTISNKLEKDLNKLSCNMKHLYINRLISSRNYKHIHYLILCNRYLNWVNQYHFQYNKNKLSNDQKLKLLFASFALFWFLYLLNALASMAEQKIFQDPNLQITSLIDRQNKQFQTIQQNRLLNQQRNIKNNSIFWQTIKLSDVKSITFFINKPNTQPTRLFTMAIQLKDGKIQTINQFYTNPNLIKAQIENMQKNISSEEKVKFYVGNKKYSFRDAMSDTISLLHPFFFIGFLWYIFRKSSPDTIINSITKSKKSFKIQAIKNINIKFNHVAGMQEAKKQITEFVDFLKKGDKYIEIGAKIPKGALLTGPPGTGKTMLAKACAGQAGVSFFYISGSQFVEMFVGLGASKVRELFLKARQQAPSIIFIDEIDAIGRKRQNSRNQQKDSTLNQLLVEMDGFGSNETVIVLAATNRKDVLDSALTRPGRLDRIVEIVLPEIKARQEIFMVHLKPLKIDPNRPLSQIAKRLAQLTPGFSGADIANLCNEAAIIAARNNQTYITDKNFQDASERITAGYEKKSLVTPKTKKRVAYHEAGHAVAGWFLKGGDPLVKLTIIPRSKGALGYAQYLPKSSYIKTKSELIDQVAIMLAGITSEEIFFQNFSTGGSDDLQKVYQVTRKMVMNYGMGISTYNMTMDDESYVRKQSQQLQNEMDNQINIILQQSRGRCKNILTTHKNVVENLANELLQKQSINREDIIRIMGQRPIFA